jgi:hypothetical protein
MCYTGEDIFIQICARVGPALMRNNAMSAEQVSFFTALQL